MKRRSLLKAITGLFVAGPALLAAKEKPTLDAGDVTWSSEGGEVTARYAVIYQPRRTGKSEMTAYAALHEQLQGRDVMYMSADGVFRLRGAERVK